VALPAAVPAVPAYLELASTVERELGRLGPGAVAPSEHQLAARFGVSRLTARAALEELERRWVVRRVQGRGTFVLGRIEYPVGPGVPPSWTEAVRLGGGEGASITESVRPARGPAWTRRLLGVDPGERLLHLRRSHLLDGELASCSETWMVASLVPGLAARLGREGSLYALLSGTYGLRPHRAWYRAELGMAPPQVAARLGLSLPARPPLALATRGRVDAAERGRPLEVTQAWARADLLRIVFEVGDGAGTGGSRR
jgi:DNA-binding GntR family transcriptional regulator